MIGNQHLLWETNILANEAIIITINTPLLETFIYILKKQLRNQAQRALIVRQRMDTWIISNASRMESSQETESPEFTVLILNTNPSAYPSSFFFFNTLVTNIVNHVCLWVLSREKPALADNISFQSQNHVILFLKGLDLVLRINPL